MPIEEGAKRATSTTGKFVQIKKFFRLFQGVLICTMAIAMAPWEELMFRGVVLWLSKNGDYGLALLSAVATSMIFGLLHKTNPWHTPWLKVFQQAILGFLYALACMATESLWPAIFAHVGLNMSVAYFILNKRHWLRLARKMQR